MSYRVYTKVAEISAETPLFEPVLSGGRCRYVPILLRLSALRAAAVYPVRGPPRPRIPGITVPVAHRTHSARKLQVSFPAPNQLNLNRIDR